MSYTTITVEGGLLPTDILEAVAAEETGGQKAGDFGLERTARLSDEIATAWGDTRAYWEAFQRTLRRLRPSDTGTSETRERWIIPLLEILGYRDLTFQPTATLLNGRTFAISHRVGEGEDALPIHIEGARTDLDERPPTGRPRLSPHGLVQEYLNRTEHLWSIVTNGERLRLLRDTTRITRPTYVEFNLRAMMEDEVFSEFTLLYRLLHRSRLPETPADAPTCWLERYYQQAIDQGGRVREGLRDGVEKAIKCLGDGFLRHPYKENAALRHKIATGRLKPQDYYRQLLRLVYRLLFLMVAEERGLIASTAPEEHAEATEEKETTGNDSPDSPWLNEAVMMESGAYLPPSPAKAFRIYRNNYSISRLRKVSEHREAGIGPYDDIWLAVQVTFEVLEGSDEARARWLGLTALDGDLFSEDAIRDLSHTRIRNVDLLGAIRALSLYRDPETRFLRRVNYGALDVEELGSVYESLLDYRPVITGITPELTTYMPGSATIIHLNTPRFELVAGTERKTTGSYYTRPELVQELIKSALDPIIDARLQAATAPPTADPQTPNPATPTPEEALLSMTVCDPACGSGHFLLAAARRIGRELARARSGEDLPTPSMFRKAVREVIARCIYGVDLNPLAVDLCKLALWIEGHDRGQPLSFLDSHIRVGNSLVGASADLVARGIPDDAFKAVSGDDKNVAAALRKRNQQETRDYETGQTAMDLAPPATPTTALADGLRSLDTTPDSSVATIREKARRYAHLREQARAQFVHYDLWCAAFFQPLTSANRSPITTKLLLDHQHTPLPFDHPAAMTAHTLANEPELQFFHWELEFPQVFSRGQGTGFAGSGDTAGFDVVLGNPPWERIKLQEQEHFVDVEAIRTAPNKAARERIIREWRTSDDAERRARIAEFDRARHRAEATSRFVRASGLFPLTAVGDVNTYALFAERDRGLINAIGRAGIIVPTGIATDDTTKRFFADLNQQKHLVSLYDFENREKLFPGVDSRYRFSLITLGQTEEPTRFVFFAANKSHLEDERRTFTLTPEEVALINPNTRTSPTFRTQADAELTKKIYRRVPVLVNERTGENPWGVSFMRMLDMSNDSHLFHTAPGEGVVPLYEAKLMHQFTHRWATYEGGNARELTPEERADPHHTITPRYWVEQAEVEARLAGKWERGWLLGWRDICRSTDERTAIFSLLPRVGANHKTPLIFLNNAPGVLHIACFLAVVNSLTFDYVTRQKLGGTSMSYFILNQLPVLPPSSFSAEDIAYIVPRVLELVYTAWDMRPFVEDVLREQGSGVGGRGSGEPVEPYQWDEERRAVLRAELDARIAHLYGLTRDELRYILDPADGYGEEFPGETFRVLKEKETRLYGEYRTRRLVLEAWDRGA